MKNNKKVEFSYTPGFMESFEKNVPPEDREEVLKAIQEFSVKLAENPYIGTPMWGGPFHFAVVLWNWVKRTLWGFGVRW